MFFPANLVFFFSVRCVYDTHASDSVLIVLDFLHPAFPFLKKTFNTTGSSRREDSGACQRGQQDWHKAESEAI